MFKTALKNIINHKFKSIMVVMGMVVSITCVITIVSIGISGFSQFNSLLSSLGLNGYIISESETVFSQQGIFTEEDVSYLINNNELIESAMPLVYKNVNFFNNSKVINGLIFGLSSDYNTIAKTTIKYGRNFTEQDLSFGTYSCIVDTDIALKIFGKENVCNEKVNISYNNTNFEFNVIGVIPSDSAVGSIIKTYASNVVFVPYTTVFKLSENNNFSSMAISVVKNEKIESIKEDILKYIKEYKGINNFQLQNMSAQQSQMNNIIGWVTGILTAVASVSVVVAGFGIMSVMLSGVTERKSEIGLKLAVGAMPQRILGEFLCEAILLSFFSGVIGLLISIILTNIIGKIIGFKVTVKFITSIISLIFCVIIGIIFSVYPAKKASSMNPIDCLRNE